MKKVLSKLFVIFAAVFCLTACDSYSDPFKDIEVDVRIYVPAFDEIMYSPTDSAFSSIRYDLNFNEVYRGTSFHKSGVWNKDNPIIRLRTGSYSVSGICKNGLDTLLEIEDYVVISNETKSINLHGQITNE